MIGQGRSGQMRKGQDRSRLVWADWDRSGLKIWLRKPKKCYLKLAQETANNCYLSQLRKLKKCYLRWLRKDKTGQVRTDEER